MFRDLTGIDEETSRPDSRVSSFYEIVGLQLPSIV